jgi:anti-anti-sigma factor
MIKPEMFDTEDEGHTLIVVPLRTAQDVWEKEESIRPETDCLFQRLGNPAKRDVVVDLTNVPYFRSNSNLLQALVAIWKHLMAHGKTMVVCNVSSIGSQILEAGNFNTLWPICSSRDEALKKIIDFTIA